jgi:hypothetical protein
MIGINQQQQMGLILGESQLEYKMTKMAMTF